ncbi:UbiA family prenyltransferase [Cruoricaptor ignavus]|uniref:UbiA family prenyltransferase n=1 Tax=Cruoricaptor ignavus TaxID=1118202 RepID=A0A7M1T2G6_9FLAO|nr:UbiA family prenyltransferase [Cruoricaptor ignavus]QOR74005.1 UbiA family prenyltransferase [Cruoricaptor ignavus]
MMTRQNPLKYRLSQLLGFLLGARIFLLVFYTFALYVSTFFVFSSDESLRETVFSVKVHGLIWCCILSIAAGGIINQFYDAEKDRLQKPFRFYLQSFLKQKYFLYSYILLCALSLFIAVLLSPRIFIFILAYQFFIWLYSHKLSKILIINNLSYVIISLYPFFGMLIYFEHFSKTLFVMADYLFCVVLLIDVLKDILTIKPDHLFGYKTLATEFGIKSAKIVGAVLLLVCAAVSALTAFALWETGLLSWYYIFSVLVFLGCFFILKSAKLSQIAWLRNVLRLWILVGVFFMLMNGLVERF